MKTMFTGISKRWIEASAIGIFAALCLAGSAASAQVTVELGPPPAEWIAVNPPVYFEGHPAYWYNGYWHYRDAYGHWGYYRNEPGFLADRRMHAMPAPHYYERHEAPRGGGGRRR